MITVLQVNSVLGFESQAGPGVSINYWEFDGVSDAASWTSGDVSSGETIVDLGGFWVAGSSPFSILMTPLRSTTHWTFRVLKLVCLKR